LLITTRSQFARFFFIMPVVLVLMGAWCFILIASVPKPQPASIATIHQVGQIPGAHLVITDCIVDTTVRLPYGTDAGRYYFALRDPKASRNHSIDAIFAPGGDAIDIKRDYLSRNAFVANVNGIASFATQPQLAQLGRQKVRTAAKVIIIDERGLPPHWPVAVAFIAAGAAIWWLGRRLMPDLKWYDAT